MANLRSLSTRVYKKAHTRDGKIPVFTDPATLMMIMALVNGIIKAIMECRKQKKEQAIQVAKKPSWFQKRTLKRHIKRHLGKEKYAEEGDYYYNALLDEAQFLTEEDIDNVYKDNESGI